MMLDDLKVFIQISDVQTFRTKMIQTLVLTLLGRKYLCVKKNIITLLFGWAYPISHHSRVLLFLLSPRMGRFLQFFKDVIYFLCCQEYLKHFPENHWFCRKSRNDKYSRGGESHVICVIMTYCIRKAICAHPLEQENVYSQKYHFEANRKNIKVPLKNCASDLQTALCLRDLYIFLFES